jgi:hypothetical protein
MTYLYLVFGDKGMCGKLAKPQGARRYTLGFLFLIILHYPFDCPPNEIFKTAIQNMLGRS